MERPFTVREINHTGITVSSLEQSLSFWRDVLGFELSHEAHQKGAMASEITGVPGAELRLAVLKGPGHRIELLEFLAPVSRERLAANPCDPGFMHVALTVENLAAILRRMAEHGWTPAGAPQTLQAGPNAGKRVVYVRDPDGITIELMEAALPSVRV